MLELIKQALPQNVALNQAITEELKQGQYAGFLNHRQVAELCQDFEITPLKLALHLLPIAACYSHTAVSHFNVGAIAIGESGIFISVQIKSLPIRLFNKPFMLSKVRLAMRGCVMKSA